MGKEELVINFVDKLSRVLTQLKSFRENITKATVVRRLFQFTPVKFDPITTTLEQFNNFKPMTLDETLGSLKVHEKKLQEGQIEKEQEQALLTHIIEKNKGLGGNSRGCGRGRNRGCGRGHVRSNGDDSYEWDRNTRDKSKIQLFNYQKFRYFAYECQSEEQKLNMAKVEEKKSTMLVMSLTERYSHHWGCLPKDMFVTTYF